MWCSDACKGIEAQKSDHVSLSLVEGDCLVDDAEANEKLSEDLLEDAAEQELELGLGADFGEGQGLGVSDRN